MSEPIAALQALRASTADLVKGLDAAHWSDADLRAPSLCPGWTRGHVLTHLARNADGITATLSGALRGEIVPRYPDGWDARNAAIETGAGRPVLVQIGDVAESAERLDRVWGAVTEADLWDAPTDQGRRAHEWVFWRLREVEIHRVDLAGDYLPDRWPPLLINELLPALVATLPDRAAEPLTVTVRAEDSIVPDQAGTLWSGGEGERTEVSGPDWAIVAWLTGRASVVADALTAAPSLEPWR